MPSLSGFLILHNPEDSGAPYAVIMSTGQFTVLDENYDHRLREVFNSQTVMKTIGARPGRFAPGIVQIELPYNENLAQHHGFLHAGIVTR